MEFQKQRPSTKVGTYNTYCNNGHCYEHVKQN